MPELFAVLESIAAQLRTRPPDMPVYHAELAEILEQLAAAARTDRQVEEMAECYR